MELVRSIQTQAGLVLAVLAALAVASPSAHCAAQAEEAPAADADAQARELYLRGDRLYAEGRYTEAIDLFRQAHELSGRPELLFNLANAYERAGQIEEAIAALRSYAPHAPAYDADTIARRIRALEGRLESGESGATEAEPEPGDTPPPRYLPDAPGAAPERTSADGDTAGGDGGGTALVATGLVILGLGLAAGGIGLGLGLAMQDASTELETLCVDGVCPEAAQDTLDRESSLALGADISFGIAGAFALTGLILTIVGATSGGDSNDDVAVTPAFGPNGGGLHVRARY